MVMSVILCVVFIVYQVLKMVIQSSYKKEIRPSKIVLVTFNIFGSIGAIIFFIFASLGGFNLTYLLYILTYIFLVKDIYTKNKKYKAYNSKNN